MAFYALLFLPLEYKGYVPYVLYVDCPNKYAD